MIQTPNCGRIEWSDFFGKPIRQVNRIEAIRIANWNVLLSGRHHNYCLCSVCRLVWCNLDNYWLIVRYWFTACLCVWRRISHGTELSINSHAPPTHYTHLPIIVIIYFTQHTNTLINVKYLPRDVINGLMDADGLTIGLYPLVANFL